jgi:hypothetical protein
MDKDEQEDLSPAERLILRRLVAEIEVGLDEEGSDGKTKGENL